MAYAWLIPGSNKCFHPPVFMHIRKLKWTIAPKNSWIATELENVKRKYEKNNWNLVNKIMMLHEACDLNEASAPLERWKIAADRKKTKKQNTGTNTSNKPNFRFVFYDMVSHHLRFDWSFNHIILLQTRRSIVMSQWTDTRHGTCLHHWGDRDISKNLDFQGGVKLLFLKVPCGIIIIILI